MSFATLAAAGGWVWVLTQVDPIRSGRLGFLFFYLTIFCVILGLATVVATGLRRWRRPQDVVSRQVAMSFRQGIWFSFLGVTALWLSAHGWLNALSTTVLVVLLAAGELLFLSARPRRSSSLP